MNDNEEVAMNDDEVGMVCAECGEWSLVYTNAGSPGRCYCPCCGAEWKSKDEDTDD